MCDVDVESLCKDVPMCCMYYVLVVVVRTRELWRLYRLSPLSQHEDWVYRAYDVAHEQTAAIGNLLRTRRRKASPEIRANNPLLHQRIFYIFSILSILS